MTSDEGQPEGAPWWGTFRVETGAAGRWDVGPSTLWLFRSENVWRLVYRPSSDPATADPMANRSEVTVPISEEEATSVLESDDERFEVDRYSFAKTESRIALEPILADRAVVARPEDALHVPSGESVTMYLSTPLWIRVVLPDSERVIQEVPSHRMSDTWFGTSTTGGHLCYATRTAGRLRPEKLPRRLHRALTPLRIENNASDALHLERVQLPVPHLGLYSTASDDLWTQAVRMKRTEGEQGADVEIRRGAPSEADDADLIQKPRDASKKGLFTSTFGAFEALFGS